MTQDRYEETSSNFEFEAGDTVLIRVREHGRSGDIMGKFVADVLGFRQRPSVVTYRAVFDPPWATTTPLELGLADAEYEVVVSTEDVNF